VVYKKQLNFSFAYTYILNFYILLVNIFKQIFLLLLCYKNITAL